MAALSRAGVVSDHVTKSQGHGGVAVVHRHYDDLLVRGSLRQAGLVQDGLFAGGGEEEGVISVKTNQAAPSFSL